MSRERYTLLVPVSEMGDSVSAMFAYINARLSSKKLVHLLLGGPNYVLFFFERPFVKAQFVLDRTIWNTTFHNGSTIPVANFYLEPELLLLLAILSGNP
ncbi:hypothetical protein C8R44DRAFT_891407 [Mycena epipterygia]|nr:hypothetical protein C8R44DRAFT_891407 [Mycena epipterygia]